MQGYSNFNVFGCRYGIVILVAEGVGVTAVVPYALMLTRRTVSTGSPGLPRDDGTVVLPQEKRFHVRILVPCYKVGGNMFTAQPVAHGTLRLCTVQQGVWPSNRGITV
jgi:hypothetical protein